MENGRLNLEMVEGKIVAVRTSSGLQRRYEDLFRVAADAHSAGTDRIATAIQAVTFGSFWLEASANHALRELLDEVTKTPQQASALWTATRRLNFPEKCSLLVNLTPGLDARRVEDVLAAARRVSDLRNRLAHFKPDHTEVPLPADFTHNFDGVSKLFVDMPDSELIRTLKADGFTNIVDAVGETHALIEDVLTLHFPARREGVASSDSSEV